MKDIIPAKKQSPILGLTGMGGGVGSNLGGSLAEKTYVDDVFSTYVYIGNGAARTINNGIDLDGEGGLVWTKARSLAWWGPMVDTVRGKDYTLTSSSDQGQAQYATTSGNEGITSFNSNGYSLGADGSSGVFNYSSSQTYASWTFRKAPGFFDCIKFTGTGGTSSSPQSISHSLKSIPGMILVKNLTQAGQWFVYHKSIGISKFLQLNKSDAAIGYNGGFSDITSSSFNVFDSNSTNTNEFIAYVFAGGESTAAGSNSIYYPSPSGTVRRILCGDASNTTADFNFGTGDLTIECWIKCSSSQGGYPRVVAIGPQWEAEMAALQWDHSENANRVSFYCYNHSSSTTAPLLRSSVKNFNGDGQYHHCAVTRSGNTWRLFVDGVMEDLQTWTGSTNTANSYCTIGNTPGSATTSWFGGYISNVRIVKGTAVYTSSFRVPTEPLKNITNTKLLCCNNLSGTAATVTPIALTETNIMQNQTDNPFDDPDNFIFGEDGDQNIIKCGSYVGTGSVGHKIELGWEPSFILFKRATGGSGDWEMVDVMRGNPASDGTTSQNANFLQANTTVAEFTNRPFSPYSTGFEIRNSGGGSNASGSTYVYMAIRRPDGYVGKPAEAGTDAFAMDTGSSSGTIPNFDSGFPVDFASYKNPGASSDWITGARLINEKYLHFNNNDAESSSNVMTYDSNVGWNRDAAGSSGWQSWMWKRGAGFDVVAYIGDGVAGRQIRHSLNKAAEMILVKRRDTSGNGGDWMVGHKGLDGGSSPWNEYLVLNKTQAEMSDYNPFNNVAPTTTSFQLSGWDRVNGNNSTYIAMLFASVEGVSKVGSYTGNASSSGPTITLGFAPRFIIIKCASVGGTNWFVYDTLRGLTAGNDKRLKLNSNGGQDTADDIDPSATGFQVVSTWDQLNDNNATYIYYAHA